jgi:hypothetical protein
MIEVMTKNLSIVASLLFVAGTAFADKDEPPPISINTGAEPAGPPPWSDQIISNGLVLPKSDLGLYGGIAVATTDYNQTPVPPLMTGAVLHDTAFELRAGIGYGVSDVFTAGGEYTLPVADANGAFTNAGRFDIYGGYSVARDDKMALVLGGDFTVDFFGGATAIIHAGASFRYKLAPKYVLYTGNLFAPGPYGRQLEIGLNHSAPVAIDLPIGIGAQLSPKLFGWAGITLAHIKLANTTNRFLFADIIPIELGAFYRMAKDVDVGGFFAIDVENLRDAISVGVLLRYYKHAAK